MSVFPLRGGQWSRVRALQPATIGAILLRDNFICAYCGRDLREALNLVEFDHVLPRAQGGPNTPQNIVVACSDCNQDRRNGPVPDHALEEVLRRISTAIDRVAGRELGDQLYPWAKARREGNREAQRVRDAREDEHGRRRRHRAKDARA